MNDLSAWNAENRRIRTIFLVSIAFAVFGLFHFYGNSADVPLYGSSAFAWMVSLWRYDQYDFSHGWLIPLVSLYVIWRKRKEILDTPIQIFPPGVFVIVLALLLHFIGYRTEQTRLSLFALVLLIWGIPLYLAGPALARKLLFPIAYLLFCIPFTFLDALSFRLRIISATASTSLLNGLGVLCVQVGTAIHSREGAFSLDVADPCSGLKYFISMAALTAVYSYLTQRGQFRRWFLFFCAVPIAVVANIIRITGIAMAAKCFGREVAVGLYHNWSGYIVFVAAVILMVATGTLIDRAADKLRSLKRTGLS